MRDTLEAAERQMLKTEESAKQKENRWAAWMKVMTPVAQDNMKRLNEASKDIVAAGTDQSSGPALHRELELLVGSGISPADHHRRSRRAMPRARSASSTSSARSKPASSRDLVLLKADPTRDINNAKLVEMVIKNGQVIDQLQARSAGQPADLARSNERLARLQPRRAATTEDRMRSHSMFIAALILSLGARAGAQSGPVFTAEDMLRDSRVRGRPAGGGLVNRPLDRLRADRSRRRVERAGAAADRIRPRAGAGRRRARRAARADVRRGAQRVSGLVA